MAKHKNPSHKPAGSGAHKGTKKVRAAHRGISGFVEQMHSVQTLHLISGFCQLFLGLAVVFIAVLGLIRPFWLSAVLTVIASVTITTGIYFSYSALSTFNSETLLRDAMRRIVEDQN